MQREKLLQGKKKIQNSKLLLHDDRAVEGKACNGDVCINGYARMKGYWQDSKGGLSTYTFVKDKIWTGVYNAHLIRWKSNTLLKTNIMKETRMLMLTNLFAV